MGDRADTASLSLLHQLNSELRSAYKQHQARIARYKRISTAGHHTHRVVRRTSVTAQASLTSCNWTHMSEQAPPSTPTTRGARSSPPPLRPGSGWCADIRVAPESVSGPVSSFAQAKGRLPIAHLAGALQCG